MLGFPGQWKAELPEGTQARPNSASMRSHSNAALRLSIAINQHHHVSNFVCIPDDSSLVAEVRYIEWWELRCVDAFQPPPAGHCGQLEIQALPIYVQHNANVAVDLEASQRHAQSVPRLDRPIRGC